MKKTHIRMNQLPSSEQPIEKLRLNGPESLSDAELLSIFINSGTREQKALDIAYTLLSVDRRFPGLEGLLKLSLHDLMDIPGIGKVKAVQLLALMELSGRISRVKLQKGIIISSPDLAAEYYMSSLRYHEQEELHVMMLNTKNQLICEHLLTKGTVNASLINPREIFIHALRENAVSIIIVHNHPSGDPTPSKEDLLATERVRNAGELIGISLIDHIIIGHDSYISICTGNS